MSKKRLLILLFGIFLGSLVQAQDLRPVILYKPIATQGIGDEEARFVESLILSYLADSGQVIFNLDNTLPVTPDYILSGSIYRERNSRIFTLEIQDTGQGEKTQSATIHSSSSDLVLKIRSLVENAFKNQFQTAKAYAESSEYPAEEPEIIAESSITGTWRGEAGIELIHLEPGGRGIAFFSSGARMELAYTIEDNTLKIRQSSPNTERYYYLFPRGIAKQLASLADPMCWELLLFSGGSRLSGKKISCGARFEEDILVDFLPDMVTNAFWVRSNR